MKKKVTEPVVKPEKIKEVTVEPVKEPEVRLEAVEVKPEPAALVAAMTTETVVKPAVKPAEELTTSIDNLAKIVDSESVATEVTAVDIPEKSESKKGYVWLAMSFLAGLALGIGVGFLVWGRVSGVKTTKPLAVKTVEVKPTQAVLPSPTVVPPTAAPTPTNLMKASLKIEVLNGTGGKGVAAKAKTILAEAGYTGVTAGNAARDDYEQTEISVKASKLSFVEELTKVLSESYTVSAKTVTLAENSSYDVIVTIGSK